MTNDLTQLSVKQIRLIGAMLMLSQVAFLAVILYLIDQDPKVVSETTRAMSMAIPALAVIVIPAAFILFRKFISQARAQPGIDQRLARYRTAVIVQLAMLEGILLFTGIALLVTREQFLLIVWAIVFAIMLMSFLSAIRSSFVHEIALGDSRMMTS